MWWDFVFLPPLLFWPVLNSCFKTYLMQLLIYGAVPPHQQLSQHQEEVSKRYVSIFLSSPCMGTMTAHKCYKNPAASSQTSWPPKQDQMTSSETDLNMVSKDDHISIQVVVQPDASLIKYLFPTMFPHLIGANANYNLIIVWPTPCWVERLWLPVMACCVFPRNSKFKVCLTFSETVSQLVN